MSLKAQFYSLLAFVLDQDLDQDLDLDAPS